MTFSNPQEMHPAIEWEEFTAPYYATTFKSCPYCNGAFNTLYFKYCPNATCVVQAKQEKGATKHANPK